MKLQLAINKVKLELRIWQPNICLKWPGFQISTYFCPALCGSGTTRLSRFIHWWGQRSAYYKKGFVFRFLWFGFIVRRGAVKVTRKKSLSQLINDWVPDDAIDYEAERLMSLTDLDQRDTF